ncbi:MAG: aminoacyl peptidase [Bacteroidetes bacterium GWB2_41_8]|nr:MAG: aminoacyl peptidase [Bacteroidetes bacterium GWB2_41_8]
MKLFIILTTLLCFAVTVNAQENMTYQKPSGEILKLVDYERAPAVMIDEKKEYMVFTYQNTYKTLEDLNQDELQLGGLRINPVTNISSSVTYSINLKVRKLIDQNLVQVMGLPANPRIANLTWSPDQTKMAFTNTTANAVELWVLDVASAKAARISEKPLNANMGRPFSWYNDNQNLLVRVIPENRAELIDFKKSLPAGPIISNSDGVKAPNRTFQDLLKNKTDEANFETLVTSELYKINLNGQAGLFMGKAMYAGESFSPDGSYLMISTIQKPFSYMVPLNRFPSKSVVFDLSGKEIKVVNEVPLTEVLPKGFMAVRKGRRNMNWRNDQPSTLYYAEALDEGNPENKVEYRDAVYQWKAPFDSEAVLMAKTIDRFSGVSWGNETTAVLYDDWYDTRNTRTYLLNPSNLEQAPVVISNRNSQDVYSDPGQFETVKNQYGRDVLLLDKDNLYLIGDGYTKTGQFPFIDQFNVKTNKTIRIYQSTFTDKLERIRSIMDIKKGEVLVQIQSKTEYPNYYLRNLKKKIALIPLTQFPNPFESIANVEKSLIKYKRKDGVELSGTLYLPVGYDKVKKEKMPLLIWAYPTEYKDKNSAGQSTSNPNEFTFPYYGSFVYWVTKGYVVLDDAAFPIIGEGKTEPNDSFISQLVDNAEAAINAVDSLGYIDRKKVAVGGHSYGAFMTANLLTHSNLFACGIARSGAYNRTLTPFGFQREQRNYWETPEVYNTMSPFMNADKMKTPLLLVHGEADNNPGTFTLQTERYFQALKGLGAPVRMVLLPKESHSYVAKENILHLLWEQDRFFEKYLKK